MNDFKKSPLYEYFFGNSSFFYLLYENEIWEDDKYWDLEIFLLKLGKEIKEQDKISKIMMINICLFFDKIRMLYQNNRDPYCYFNIKNKSEDEIQNYWDRFEIIKEIFLGISNYENIL